MPVRLQSVFFESDALFGPSFPFLSLVPHHVHVLLHAIAIAN